MDYFVTCYFNFYKFVHKENLCINFCNKHNNVILLMPNRGDLINNSQVPNTHIVAVKTPENLTGAHLQFYLLNKFVAGLKSYRSVTLLDSDLILESDYFEKVTEKVKSLSGPYIIHGFDTCEDETYFDANGTQHINVPMKSIIKQKGYGHSGLSWVFTKEAFDILGKLPTVFIIGGQDYILALCLLQDDRVLELINNNKYKKVIKLLFSKCKKIKTGFIHSNIMHKYHGPKDLRNYNGRWEMYDTDNFSLEGYWLSRGET